MALGWIALRVHCSTNLRHGSAPNADCTTHARLRLACNGAAKSARVHLLTQVGRRRHSIQATIRTFGYSIVSLMLSLALCLVAQTQDSANAPQESTTVHRAVNYLVNYLNMAGATKAEDFKPLTQSERNRLYLKTMVNPLGYVKTGFSAGIDQWKDKPGEWEQGASGYGKRFANILGQYSIQRTVTFGLSSMLHEDTRYFNSGKRRFWPRIGYAVSSGILARSDDGSRHISVSQLGGVAAGAFLSRTWQPPSQSSPADGAVSFGITMGSNMGFGVLKEFLPDLGRAIQNKHRKTPH